MEIVYLRSHKRRPVRQRPRYGPHDVQGEIPAGWCRLCGKEIYTYPAGEVCGECKKRRNFDA